MPKVVELSLVDAQAKADIAYPVPPGQLSEEQLQERVPAVKPVCTVILVIAVHALLELVTDHQRKYLGKNILACIHNLGLPKGMCQFKSKNQRTTCNYYIYCTFKGVDVS